MGQGQGGRSVPIGVGADGRSGLRRGLIGSVREIGKDECAGAQLLR